MPLDPSTLPNLTISLDHGDTDDYSCRIAPMNLFEEFTLPSRNYQGYGEIEVNVSVFIIPDDIEKEWWGSPASYWMRQKVRRAIKLGYEFRPFEFNDHLEDIYEINTSKAERQGRTMTEWYRERPERQEPSVETPCARHRNGHFGVFQDGKLYAYVHILHSGEMMMFSGILGHGDRMEDGIMNLIVFEAVKWHRERAGTSYAVYYLQDSGTEGLQFFKRKMGFAGYVVRWALSRPRVAGEPAERVEVSV